MLTSAPRQHDLNALDLIIALIASAVNCRCSHRCLIDQFQRGIRFFPAPVLRQSYLSDRLYTVRWRHCRLRRILRAECLVDLKGHCRLRRAPVAVRRSKYHLIRRCVAIGNGRPHRPVLPCEGSGYVSGASAQLALRKCLSVGDRCRRRLLRDLRRCLSKRKRYHCRRRLIVYIIRRCKDSHIAIVFHRRYHIRVLPAPASVHGYYIVADRPCHSAARPDTAGRARAVRRCIAAHRHKLAERLHSIINNA